MLRPEQLIAIIHIWVEWRLKFWMISGHEIIKDIVFCHKIQNTYHTKRTDALKQCKFYLCKKVKKFKRKNK